MEYVLIENMSCLKSLFGIVGKENWISISRMTMGLVSIFEVMF